MRRLFLLAVALLIALLGAPQADVAAATAPTAATSTYSYDGHHHASMTTAASHEWGPHEMSARRPIYGAVELGSHGASAHSETTAIYSCGRWSQLTLDDNVGTAGPDPVWAADGRFAAHAHLHLAAKTGFEIVEGGVRTRAINFRPSGVDLNWGLTPAHLTKHLFGSSKYSLSKIDPGGNSDIWFGYVQDVASRTVTSTTSNGMRDIIGTFPRTGGVGTFQLGIRLSPTGRLIRPSHAPHEAVTMFTCPVCDYPGLTTAPYELWPPAKDLVLKPPYELQLGRPSYEVCPKCGFEFGNDDNPGTAEPASFEEYRAEWIDEGMPWFNEGRQ